MELVLQEGRGNMLCIYRGISLVACHVFLISETKQYSLLEHLVRQR